ncbi:MAG: hypothetical protein M1836_003565 [Candelina mexicana]|nr:MAG: hypothetical protein M1836_003565 [Candelina mexicana]
MKRSPIVVTDDDDDEILPSPRATRVRNASQPLTSSSSKQRGSAPGSTKDPNSGRSHQSRPVPSTAKEHLRKLGSAVTKDSSDCQTDISSSRSKTRSALRDVDSSPELSITHVRPKQPRNHELPPNIRSSRTGARIEQFGPARPKLRITGAENIIDLVEDDAEEVINPPSTGRAPTDSKRGSVQQGLPTDSDSPGKSLASGRPPTSDFSRVSVISQAGMRSFQAPLEIREAQAKSQAYNAETDQISTALKAHLSEVDKEIGVSARVSHISNSISPDKEQATLTSRNKVPSGSPNRPGMRGPGYAVRTSSTVPETSASQETTREAAMGINPPKIQAGSVPGSPSCQALVPAALIPPELAAGLESLEHRQEESLEDHNLMEVSLEDHEKEVNNKSTNLTVAAMEQVFQEHIKELQHDHRYFMKSWLNLARRACNKDKTLDTLPISASERDSARSLTRQPARFIQTSSPFANMRAIEISHPVKSTEPGVPCGRLSQLIVKTSNGKPESRNFTVPVTTYKSEAVTIPSYTSYITLSRNILAVNDKDMKYFPYFGEDINVEKGVLFRELEQTFNNRVQDLPLCRLRAEQADKFRPYAEAALDELGCSMGDILRYLLEDHRPLPMVDMSSETRNIWLDRTPHLKEDFNKEENNVRKVLDDLPPRVDRAVAVAGLACRAFLNVTKFSLWHIAKTDQHIFAAGLPGKLSQGTLGSTAEAHAGANLAAQSLGTYSELGCLICHVHDCPGHGEYEEPNEDSDAEEQLGGNRRVRVTVVAPMTHSDQKEIESCKISSDGPSVFECLGKNNDGTVTGINANDQNKERPAYPDSQECSTDCFWKKENRVEIVPQWPQHQLDLFDALLPAWVNSRRGPCMIACAVGKPCSEVFTMISSSSLAKARNSKEAVGQSSESEPKRKPQYCDTKDHEKRKPFLPCSHMGPCETAKCSCFEQKIHCEKICACSWACQRRFRGCRCAQTAKACWQNKKCDCYVLNRECDEDLCHTCGAVEVLDPVNRYNNEVAKVRCSNVYMQRGVPKHTLLGHSEIQGWGLNMGEAVTAGEFLGEYKGEVLSNAEAVRRGAIYAQKETCYLFTLNAEQVIDSTRAGNKFRFINDSSERYVNCESKVMFCNGIWRIGLYALRDVKVGEELFFSYNYPDEVTKHFWDKDGPRTQLVGVKPQKGKLTTAKKSGSGKRGGARRGAGRKSRPKKAAPRDLRAKEKDKAKYGGGKEVLESDFDDDDEAVVASIADSGDQDVYQMEVDSSEAEETPYEDESPHRRTSRKSRKRRY